MFACMSVVLTERIVSPTWHPLWSSHVHIVARCQVASLRLGIAEGKAQEMRLAKLRPPCSASCRKPLVVRRSSVVWPLIGNRHAHKVRVAHFFRSHVPLCRTAFDDCLPPCLLQSPFV